MFWITKILSTDLHKGWSVIDANGNLYTSKLLPKEEAEAVCDEANTVLLYHLST